MLSKSVISEFAALCFVLPLLGCQKGGGKFVGKEADPRRNKQCALCVTEAVPAPVDCAKEEQGVEFLPVTIWDFEAEKASNMYTYSDGSGLYHGTNTSWQPPTEVVERCVGAGPGNVFHYQAGPFTNWGGAVGRHFKCLNGSPQFGKQKFSVGNWMNGTLGCDAADPSEACTVAEGTQTPANELAWTVCPERDRPMALAFAANTGSGFEIDTSTVGHEEYLLGMTLDFSQWDGISFWARRSSDSQPGIRVSIGDRFTDDDLSFMQMHVNPDDVRSCERNVECGCNGNSECSVKSAAEGGDGSERCWDLPPAFHNPTTDMSGVPKPPECGQSLCADATGAPHIYDSTQHPDEQRRNTTCQQFRFNGGIEGGYCYNEANPPKENSELCGDHWTYPVYLSTEWQFYKVPFTSLLQQGWAKKFDKLDISSAALIRFQWGTGWLDFWLDDVRVYRETQNTGKH